MLSNIDITQPPLSRVPLGVEDYDLRRREAEAGGGYVLYLGHQADGFPAWGTDPVNRDIKLREFWPTEPYLASAFGSQIARYASFPFILDGPTRTTSICDSILNGAENGQGFQTMMVKIVTDIYCLHRKTSISLGGNRLGKTKTIRDMVLDKDPGPVLSLGSDGIMVEKEVNEWLECPLADRKWYWLTLEVTSSYSQGLFLTEDHPMLTDKGWKQARDITTDMRVATSDMIPSSQQKEVLVGTLLGDGQLKWVTNRANLSFTHCEAQEEWLQLKQRAFTGFQWTGYTKTKPRQLQGYTCQPVVSVSSRVSAGFNRFYALWYKNGRKVVPINVVRKYFSDRMLATWYCDDGSYQNGSAMLCTDSFTQRDVEKLISLLEENGLECVLRWCNGYPRIQFTRRATRQLIQRISSFVPQCLRYKLGDITKEYSQSLWKLVPPEPYFDKVKWCGPRDAYNGRSIAKTTYHIGVEDTHNFVAAGMISHNTQSNCGWMELIRTSDDPAAPVISMRHMDAGRCRRTGYPDEPVIYWDLRERPHIMKWYQVIEFPEMPSPNILHRGLQLSVLDRILKAAQIMKAIQQFKLERVTGIRHHKLHLLGGFNQGILDETMKQKLASARSVGLQAYVDPVILAALNPTGTVSHETIDLNELPPDFNEEVFMKWYIGNISLAWEDDYTSFFPLPGGNLGSAGQSQTLADKSRSKGPAVFMRMVEHKFNYYGVLPRTVKFHFGEQDSAADAAKMQVFWRFAALIKLLLDAQSITPEVSQLMLRDAGYLKPEYLKLLGVVDPTPQSISSDAPQASVE